MFTRLTATVTISAPDAVCACAITAFEGYLPVPTMSRERNVRPAMTKEVSAVKSQIPNPKAREARLLASADEVHDLHGIAFAHDDIREGVALEDGQVVLNGDTAGVDVELGEQFGDRNGTVELEGFPVQDNVHVS